jgi:hypothetical protein
MHRPPAKGFATLDVLSQERGISDLGIGTRGFVFMHNNLVKFRIKFDNMRR